MRLRLRRVLRRGAHVAVAREGAAILRCGGGESLLHRTRDELRTRLRPTAPAALVWTQPGTACDCRRRVLRAAALRHRSDAAQPPRCARTLARPGAADSWR